jgi:hypothetical protein
LHFNGLEDRNDNRCTATRGEVLAAGRKTPKDAVDGKRRGDDKNKKAICKRRR